MPAFSPEHFARIQLPDPLRRKHLDKGLLELSEEGAIQVFFTDGVSGPGQVVGVVGPLQFECSSIAWSTSTEWWPSSSPCPSGKPGG
jgi:peptide subunit release factor RF-3